MRGKERWHEMLARVLRGIEMGESACGLFARIEDFPLFQSLPESALSGLGSSFDVKDLMMLLASLIDKRDAIHPVTLQFLLRRLR